MTAPATLNRTIAGAVRPMPLPVKVVVLGGRAVGRTRLDMFVDAVSELPHSGSIMPYGRCAVSDRLAVHLYGMPEQQRYWFMWDSVSRGAVAALVLADARRLADCFPAIDYATGRGMPYLVAVANAEEYRVPQLREALLVPDEVPVLPTTALTDPDRPDPNQRRGARDLLHALVRHAVTRRHSTTPAA